MIDLDKVYSKEELLSMKFFDFSLIRAKIDNYYDNAITKKEKKILEAESEIIYSPYSYALNPFHFQIGKEKQAEKKDKKNFEILEKALEIKKRILRESPPNMRQTIPAIISIYTEKPSLKNFS